MTIKKYIKAQHMPHLAVWEVMHNKEDKLKISAKYNIRPSKLDKLCKTLAPSYRQVVKSIKKDIERDLKKIYNTPVEDIKKLKDIPQFLRQGYLLACGYLGGEVMTLLNSTTSPYKGRVILNNHIERLGIILQTNPKHAKNHERSRRRFTDNVSRTEAKPIEEAPSRNYSVFDIIPHDVLRKLNY